MHVLRPRPLLPQLINTDRAAADPAGARNLSTFVCTWMEAPAAELMARTAHVNLADLVQYPAFADMHAQCVRMLSRLYHAPQPAGGAEADISAHMGAATVGSTEAATLGALALKLKWRAARRAAGLPADAPNLVMGHEAHLALEKFCALFDVEPRFIDVSEEKRVMDPNAAVDAVDENTIGVIATLGSTYTGQFEDVAALDALLGAKNAQRGWDVGIHVDAASGGFIAPFTRPQLAWDFRLARVRSLNVSGHKYGGVYCGIGWVLFRSRECVPDAMVFSTTYLGSTQESLTLNFSRPAAQLAAQ